MKKLNKKQKSFLILLLFGLVFFLSSFKTIPYSKADISDNYSQYLTNSPININDDKAKLLKEMADNGNEYRNYLENDFLIPSKLSNEMFSTYDSGKTSYSVSQAYLSNLENSENYMSNDNNENIIVQNSFNTSDINNYNLLTNEINNGNYYFSDIDFNTQEINSLPVETKYYLHPNGAELSIQNFDDGNDENLRNNTLQLYHSNTADSIDSKFCFDSETTKGTFEFSILFHSNEYIMIHLGQYTPQYDVIRIYFDENGNFGYYYDYQYYPITGYDLIDWIHITIEFDFSITPNTFNITYENLNTNYKMNYYNWLSDHNNPSAVGAVVNYFRLQTYSTRTDETFWMDVFDISSSEGYYLNRSSVKYSNNEYNLYKTNTKGNFEGSDSFDYQMEEGYYYMSDLDDFNYEEDYETNFEWSDTDSDGTDCESSIINNLDSHYKVLRQYDNSASAQCNQIHNFDSTDNDKIIEWWWTVSDVSKTYTSYVYFTDNQGTDSIVLTISTDDLLYIPSGGGYSTIKSNFITNNNFFHIKICIDDSENTFDIYVNGVLEGNDLSCYQTINSYIAKMKLKTLQSTIDYSAYFDAIGIISENNYQESYNINPYDISELLDNSYYFDFALNNSYLKIENEIDNHNNVLDIYDNQQNIDEYDRIEIYNYFSDDTNQIEGSIEFWMRSSDTSKTSEIRIGGSGGYIRIYFHSNKIKIYDGSFVDVCNAYSNIWYHMKIDFDCLDDSFTLYIDKENKGVYNFHGNGNSVYWIFYRSDAVDYNYHLYIDAFDYSWSDNYFSFKTYDSGINSYISFEQEIIYNYPLDSNYKPVLYDLNIQLFFTNISTIYNVYLYNYDINYWNKIKTINSFNIYTFQLNESTYLNRGKVLVKIENEMSNFTNYNILVPALLEINCTHILENESGFQEIIMKFKEYDTSDIYLGSFELVLQIYKSYIAYKYAEYSEGYSNYGNQWIIFNLTENSIELKSLELLGMIRFGYNTLIQEIANIRFEILINSNEYNLTIIEQNRIGSFNGIRYTNELNYTAYNNNFLNITGVVGNYSYCALNGFRCLKGVQDEIYNRYFTIPNFYQDINLHYTTTTETIEIEDEPEAPAGLLYWTYETYRVVEGITFYTEVGNWSIPFTPIKPEKYVAKFYYNPATWQPHQLGSWKFKIGDFKISFNFLRDAVCSILNLLMLLIQFVGFIVVMALSYVFMFIVSYILAFLVNIVLYWMFIGLCLVGWYIVIGLQWILEGLVWIWKNFILPFLEWFWNEIVPVLIDWCIMIIAHAITILIYIITLGQINYDETYQTIYELLWLIVKEIYELILTLLNNIVYVLLFILWYFYIIGLLFLNYLYCRARGFVRKAKKYYYTLQFFLFPIKFIYSILSKGKESIPII